MNGLNKIETESKRFLGVSEKGTLEEFRQCVFEKIFWKELGYSQLKSSRQENDLHEIIVNEKLKIKITLDEINDKNAENQLFGDNTGEKENSLEWGIILSPKGIWLLNDKVFTDDRSVFKGGKIILQIVHGINTDQKYFDFFSYENILGDKLGAYFFKDIIQYKNRDYKGSEKSWPAYGSSLKRFFSYYSTYSKYFNDEADKVYNRIKLRDFYHYINEHTGVKKENTSKNIFFYLKDFMGYNSDKRAFEISTQEMLDGFNGALEKDERQDVIEPEKLKKAIQYLDKGKNRERDVALFLMELSFGLERRKLRFLKWKTNIRYNENSKICIEDKLRTEGKERIMPKELIKALGRLRALGVKGDYVFYRTRENGNEPIQGDVINSVFSKLAKIDPEDEYYKLLTPANIRGSLIRCWLNMGTSLEKIIYLMDMEIWNLGNYISLKDIDGIMKNRIKEKKEEGHPMDSMLEDSLVDWENKID